MKYNLIELIGNLFMKCSEDPKLPMPIRFFLKVMIILGRIFNLTILAVFIVLMFVYDEIVMTILATVAFLALTIKYIVDLTTMFNKKD